MIHPLRNRHCSLITFLAFVLPVLFVVSIAFRPAPQEIDPDGDRFFSKLGQFPHIVWTENNLWKSFPNLQTRLLADQASASRIAIELSATESLIIPDLLVYWSPLPASEENVIPENAYFIGVFNADSSTPYLLPSRSKDIDGYLILYSLAYQETAASTSIKTASALDPSKVDS